MTVAEFIAELEKFPKDAVVLYRCCSTWFTMEPGDAKLSTPDAVGGIVRHGPNGQYMDCPRQWVEEGRAVEYVTAVCLPGN